MNQQDIKQFIANNETDAILNWLVEKATQEEKRTAYSIIMENALSSTAVSNSKSEKEANVNPLAYNIPYSTPAKAPIHP